MDEIQRFKVGDIVETINCSKFGLEVGLIGRIIEITEVYCTAKVLFLKPVTYWGIIRNTLRFDIKKTNYIKQILTNREEELE